MNTLSNYTGNAGLGLGSNSIPVTTTGDLDGINQLGKDLMLFNHQNNIALFNQKVKDRDTLYNLLAEGEASTNKIRDEDRKIYNDAKSDVNNAFMELAKSGGINNAEAMRKYKEKVGYLNQVATQAQARYKLLGDEEAEIGKETRDPIRQERLNNLKANIGNFWGNYQPYQEAYNYNIDDYFKNLTTDAYGTQQKVPTATTDRVTITDKDGKITTKKTQITKPIAGKQPLSGETVIENNMAYNVTPSNELDFTKVLENSRNLELENKDYAAQGMRNIQDDFNKGNPVMQGNMISGMVKAAKDYNAMKGFTPDENGNYPEGAIDIERLIGNPQQGIPGYIHLKDPNDPRKGWVSEFRPSEFTAYFTLANTPLKTGGAKVFDKDLTAAMQKGSHDKAMEAIARQRANAYSSLQNKKGKAIDNQFNPQQVFDETFKGIMETYKTQAGNFVTRVNAANMSSKLKSTLGINPLNTNGDYNLVPSNITYNGKQIDENTIQSGYPNWLESDGAKKIKEANNGKTPNIFDYIYSLGGNFDVEVVGTNENGKITRSNRLQSLINQSKETGIKGKDIIKLLSDNENPNESSFEETSVTNSNSQ